MWNQILYIKWGGEVFVKLFKLPFWLSNDLSVIIFFDPYEVRVSYAFTLTSCWSKVPEKETFWKHLKMSNQWKRCPFTCHQDNSIAYIYSLHYDRWNLFHKLTQKVLKWILLNLLELNKQKNVYFVLDFSIDLRNFKIGGSLVSV